MNHQLLFSLLALKLTHGIGAVIARNLISYAGSPEAVFKLRKRALLKIPSVGSNVANSIIKKESFEAAEKEVNFILKKNIDVYVYFNKNYPNRMKHHSHLPFLIFSKGKPNLNTDKTLGIVGTRKCTNYGKEITKTIIQELSDIKGLSIISGLAFGIDKIAHQAAVNCAIPTTGVLGHGLHTIYPSQNKKLASQMLDQEESGLVSQFCSYENFVPANFPKRNEVIAALSDAVLVIETDVKGGSKITADLAFDMNKDVLAIPGRVNDKFSSGCNQLIKYHKAALVESAKDIKRIMNWETGDKKIAPQRKLFVELNETENELISILKSQTEWPIDQLSVQSSLTSSGLSATLLNLELKGIVQSLPGKIYKLLYA